MLFFKGFTCDALAATRAIALSAAVWIYVTYVSDLRDVGSELAKAWPYLKEHLAWASIGVLLAIAFFWNLVRRLSKNLCLRILHGWRHIVVAFIIVTIVILYDVKAEGAVKVAAFVALCGFSTFALCPRRIRKDEPNDSLNRTWLVNRLALHLESSNSGSLRRFAIIGEWGAGKTRILELLQHRLKKSEKTFRTTLVNPWQASTPEEAWAILAKGFDQALGNSSTLSTSWAKHPLVTKLLKFLPFDSSIAFDALEVISGRTGGDYRDQIDRLNRRLSREKGSIVLLIDDMERAAPDVVRSMFPVIDRLKKIEHCFFVFAIDSDRIAKAFHEESRNQDETKGYLDKVFDLLVEIPPPEERDLYKLCQDSVSSQAFPKLAQALPDLRSVLSANPRGVVRFLRDSTSKEALFLHRYDEHDRHNYSAFFALRLLEVDYSGVGSILLEDSNRSLYNKLVLASTGTTPVLEEADLSELTENLVTAMKIGEDRQPRFRILLKHFLQLAGCSDIFKPVNFSLEWAVDKHTMLIEFSAPEIRKARELFHLQFAQTSLLEIVDEVQDSGEACKDRSRCAVQLIGLELDEIDEQVNSYSGIVDNTITNERLRAAGEIYERLSDHLRWATESGSPDQQLFGVDLLDRLLKLFDNNPLASPREGDRDFIEKFKKSRIALSLAVVNNLSTFEELGRANRLVGDSWGADGGPPAIREEIVRHRQLLDQELARKGGELVSKLFQSKDGFAEGEWPYEKLPGGPRFFLEPSWWCPVIDSEYDLTTLKALSDKARTNNIVANRFANLVWVVFLAPFEEAAGSRHHPQQRAATMELAKRTPDYLRLFWTASNSPAVDETHAKRLEAAYESALGFDHEEFSIKDAFPPISHEDASGQDPMDTESDSI